MHNEQTPAAARTDRLCCWLMPSWLGLDAPCVVSTWTWATSRALEVTFPILPVVALFLVVWFIYLLDRCLDVATCRDWTHATGRLQFGRNYRPLFQTCLALCLLGLLVILSLGLPRPVIARASLVACGVGLHFLAFIRPVVLGKKLPGKEFGVGIFFALGAFACLGVTTRSLPLLASIALLVAYNCLVIAARDADCDQTNDPGAASHWWRTINRDLPYLGLACAITAAIGAALTKETPFYLSVTTAFTALIILHLYAHRLTGDTVRAQADYALMTPLPIMGAFPWASILLGL